MENKEKENEFREIVENSIKQIKDSGTELTSGVIMLYGNDEKETNFVRLMSTTSEDKSRFRQTAISLAERAGLDYKGIENELAHLLFCESLHADMVEQASKSLYEKLYVKKSPKKEMKKFGKFLYLMAKMIADLTNEKVKEEAAAAKEESTAGSEAAKHNM